MSKLLIDIQGLEAMGAQISQLSSPGLKNAIRASLRGAGGEALATEMKLRAPKRTGRLAAQIGIKDGVGGEVSVGYQGEDNIGTFVESGTKPHTIKARQNKAMWFGGHWVKSVEHPGFRGRFVAKKSLKAAEWEVLADITDKINEMV